MLLSLLSYIFVANRVVDAILRCSFDNYSCPPSAPCCSIHGYCGFTAEYCSPQNCLRGCTGALSFKSNWRGTGTIEFSELTGLRHLGVESGCKNPKHASLTYDDGIHVTLTPTLLDTLKKKGVKATFFILGRTIARYHDFGKWSPNPHREQNLETLKRMVKEGHTIASHTFDHTVLPGSSRKEMKKQMDATAKLIKRATGYYPRLMRAPEGQALKRLRRWHYKAIHWTADTLDWMYQGDPDHIVRYIKYELPRAGETNLGPIILQHDTYYMTVQAQSRVIDELRAKGYELVPIDVCLGIEPYHRYSTS